MAVNVSENKPIVLLDEFSADRAVELIPVNIYVGVLIPVGLSGNILVIVFYSRQQIKSPTTMLILTVAVMDAIACILMPKNFFILAYPYRFTSTLLCKFNIFINHVTSMSSGVLLCVIAVFRYRGICRPFKPPITTAHAYCSIALTFALTFLLSAPIFILYESLPILVNVGVNNTITGYDCVLTKDDSLQTVSLIENVAIAATFVVTFSSFTIFYWKIAVGIYEHKKKRRSLMRIYTHGEDTYGGFGSSTRQTISSIDVKEETHENNTSNNKGSVPCKDRPAENKSVNMRAISVTAIQQTPMLMTVTAAHMISFLPYIVITIVYSVLNESRDEMKILDQLCLKSYLINGAINPLIYLFFNKTFRHFVTRKVTCQ